MFSLVYFGLKVPGMLLSGLRLFGKHVIRRTGDKMKRVYNANGGSWAVVSGGSDGMGLAMCQNLAKQGFNICMVARNEEKMKTKI